MDGGTGVGYLGLYDIGVPGMAGAYEHVNAIARGIKRLGDTRTLDQLRADTALNLLTGGTSPLHTGKPTGTPKTRTTPDSTAAPTHAAPEGQPTAKTRHQERPDTAASDADSTATVDHHVEAPTVTATGEERSDGAASGADTTADGDSRVGQADAATIGEQRPDEAARDSTTDAGPDTDPDLATTTAQDDAEDEVADAANRAEQSAAELDPAKPDAERKPEARIPSSYPVPRARADVDLIVSITTLADLADALRRGELIEVGGYGLVPADIAARLVKAAAARPSTWCMTVIDNTGRVVEHVRTHHDPTKVGLTPFGGHLDRRVSAWQGRMSSWVPRGRVTPRPTGGKLLIW